MSLDGALAGATHVSGGLLLRLIQVALPVYQRGEVVIYGCNVPEIIVADIAKNDRLNIFSRQCLGINLIQLVFLQCGEKAFHSGIVIAASRATHALNSAIFFAVQRGIRCWQTDFRDRSGESCFWRPIFGMDV